MDSAAIRLKALPILWGRHRLVGSKRKENLVSVAHSITCRTLSRQSQKIAQMATEGPFLTSDRQIIKVMAVLSMSKSKRWRRVQVALDINSCKSTVKKWLRNRAARNCSSRWSNRPDSNRKTLLHLRMGQHPWTPLKVPRSSVRVSQRLI